MNARTLRLLRFLFEDNSRFETAAALLNLYGQRRTDALALWTEWELTE